MAKEKDPKKPRKETTAPREGEKPSAAPGPDEAIHSSVEEDDIARGGELQTAKVGAAGAVDPWAGHMKDLARLVLAAYEIDPHRFDKPKD